MARNLICRLCWESVPDNRMTHLFTRKSLERGWASRIAILLQLDHPVQEDNLPAHVCSKCLKRVVALEKASIDLAAFRKSSKSVVERAHQSLRMKRTKETTGEVGVSPHTLRERPRSKIARRLSFTSKIYYTCQNTHTQRERERERERD